MTPAFAIARPDVLPADGGDGVRGQVRRRDGGGPRGSRIVLVGVSRTSKTPLSIYLGYLGYKTANVPIVKGIDPPPELFEIDPAKIVGLTLEASRLAEIRQARLRHMGSSKRQYAELAQIYDELEQATLSSAASAAR